MFKSRQVTKFLEIYTGICTEEGTVV